MLLALSLLLLGAKKKTVILSFRYDSSAVLTAARTDGGICLMQGIVLYKP